MTLQQMKYILEIANYNSFSDAAKALFVSQSTLSVAVKEIEDSFGISIFGRNNRGIVLTNEGRDFLKRIQDIVDQVDELEDHYIQRQYLPMRFSVSAQRLSFATRAFNRLLSNIDLSTFDIAMRECSTNSVIQDVSTGKSDLGVIVIDNRNARIIQRTLESGGLCFTELNQLNTYAFMRKSHPLADRKEVSVEELKEYAFVTYDQEINSTHFTEETVFYEQLEKNVHVCDRCTKIALIRGNNCFSIGPDLPNSNADAMHRNLAEICAVPIKEITDPLHVGYITRKDQFLTSIGEEYVSALDEEIKELKTVLSSN